MEQKVCESCGMPMKMPEDFGGQNPNNKYCKYCTDENGNLKSFNEKIHDLKNLFMRTQNLGEPQALKLAKEYLIKQPAWKDQAI